MRFLSSLFLNCQLPRMIHSEATSNPIAACQTKRARRSTKIGISILIALVCLSILLVVFLDCGFAI